MFFPLLESLLKKDPASSKSLVHDFFRTQEDLSPLFKSVLTFSAQHATGDVSNMDAVVALTAVINIIKCRTNEVNQSQKEILMGHGIDFLCRIPVESIDSSVLKPAREDARVVSISEVGDTFESDDINGVLAAVRDLLSLMDNKKYFMEIMYGIALKKSVQSISLAAATSRAIEIMGWQNNFTPFLIHHLVVKMFNDRDRFETTSEAIVDEDIFGQMIHRICTVEHAQLMSALFWMHSDSKILSNKLRPKIRHRVKTSFNSNNNENNVRTSPLSEIEKIVFQSCIEDLSVFDDFELLKLKIPFVV